MCFLSFSISKYLKYVLKTGSTAKHEPVCLHVLHKRYAALVFFVLSKDGQLHCIYKTNVPTSHYRHVYFKVNWTWLICVPAVHGARDKISGNYLFIYFPTTNLNCFCSLIITISFQKGLKKRNFPHTYHSTYYLIWAGFIRNNELSFDTWISRGTWRAP